jgi:hypothetical protein
MELIYIAKSKQFPGMVKIGRTDRSVETRMQELSEDNYGTSGFSGDSEWEAIRIIEVGNNESAEEILHNHFSDFRVEGGRELFYTDSPEALADEAMGVVDGADFLSTFDSVNALFGGLSIVSAVAGITVLVRTFFPDNAEVWKLSRAIDGWGQRLKTKTLSSNTFLGTVIYGALWGSFTISKVAGEFVPRIIEGVVKEINEQKNRDTYLNFLELQAEMVGIENVEYITALSLKRYQNYEVSDLFLEQWRQFEILWARKQADKRVKEFQDSLTILMERALQPKK